MLKKTISFKDLDGNNVTEDFYFNLTKAEAMEVQFSHKGGLAEHAERIIKAEDMGQLISLFKELIQKSVGRRSEDGRRFIKNQEIVDDFMQTDAYSELFFELATNAEVAAKFMTGIVPADLEESVARAISGGKAPVETAKDVTGAVSGAKDYDALLNDANWQPNADDLRAMSPEQLQRAFTKKAGFQGTAAQ